MGPLIESLGREHLPVAALRAIHAQWRARPEFASQLISALGQLDPAVACRAVWLLRRQAAESPLRESELARIVELVDGSEHWIYRLTLCQLFAATGCPPASRDDLFPFLQRCFADRRVIIRAWALTAMLRFRDDPAYRRAIRQCERQAQRDPGKAMQARLRQLALNRPIRGIHPSK